MNKEKKNTRGITLIALVVSVIVLLVLAGITIAALSGDNGILTRAKEAKEKTEQAQKEEKQTVSNMEDMLENIEFKNINTEDTKPGKALPANVTILENNGNKGIVIKDQNNNEWVWIEVPKTTVFADLTIDTTTELTEQDYNSIRDKLIEYVEIYRNGSATQTKRVWTDEWYAMDGEKLITASTENLTNTQKSLTNGCGLTYDEYKKAYQKMLKSVYTYGGFWIGRYEAGIEGSIEDISKARNTHTNIIIGESPKAINQKNAIPYNIIYCSEAQILANEMNPDNTHTSSLMFGIQWDLVCKFLEVNTDLTISDINTSSSNWGNYKDAKIEKLSVGKYMIYDETSGKLEQNWKSIGNDNYTKENTGDYNKVLLSTGISNYMSKMNIYDFAGNTSEWTLEKSDNLQNPCVCRGGGYYTKGNEYPASSKENFDIQRIGSDYGFRSTFY